MSQDADSRQYFWQHEFQKYSLTPFSADKFARAIRYHDFTSAKFWWHNPINPNSLRLTAGAWNILKQSKDLPNWTFKLPQGLLPRTYLQLERHFTSPYYIKSVDQIVVFSDRDSMMLALHGNNLQQYLDNHDDFG